MTTPASSSADKAAHLDRLSACEKENALLAERNLTLASQVADLMTDMQKAVHAYAQLDATSKATIAKLTEELNELEKENDATAAPAAHLQQQVPFTPTGSPFRGKSRSVSYPSPTSSPFFPNHTLSTDPVELQAANAALQSRVLKLQLQLSTFLAESEQPAFAMTNEFDTPKSPPGQQRLFRTSPSSPHHSRTNTLSGGIPPPPVFESANAPIVVLPQRVKHPSITAIEEKKEDQTAVIDSLRNELAELNTKYTQLLVDHEASLSQSTKAAAEHIAAIETLQQQHDQELLQLTTRHQADLAASVLSSTTTSAAGSIASTPLTPSSPKSAAAAALSVSSAHALLLTEYESLFNNYASLQSLYFASQASHTAYVTKLDQAKKLVIALNNERKELLEYKQRKRRENEKLRVECRKFYNAYLTSTTTSTTNGGDPDATNLLSPPRFDPLLSPATPHALSLSTPIKHTA